MDKQKLKWIVPGVVVGLGVLWWAGSWYASGKAEDRLRAKLAEYGLQDRVHWKSVDASLFGSVTLKDVTVDVQHPGQLRAESLKISDVIDKKDRQRVALQVRGLTEAGGQGGALLGKAVGLPTGRAELPPMDATLKVDARFDDDEAELELTVRQKDALDADYSLEVTQIAALRGLPQIGGSAANMGAMGMGGMGMFGALASLSRVSLKSLEARIEDRGMVERGIALYKRHNIPLDADAGSAKSQRDKAFEQDLKAWEDSCRMQGPAMLTQDPRQTCLAAARFLSGDKDTLRLSVKPKNPVSAEQLMGLMFGRAPASAASMLNAEVKS